ncbi:hypothetical protein ACWENQ_41180 [Nonomuraea sp. NPDC004354]
MGRISRSLLGLAAAIATVSAAFAAPAAAHASTARMPCNPAFQPSGLIGEVWQSTGAGNGELACPVAKERQHGQGAMQEFWWGTIVRSPNLGPRGVMTVVDKNNGKIVFRWKNVSALPWDYFEVAYNTNPGLGNKTHVFKAPAATPSSGSVTLRLGQGADFAVTTNGHAGRESTMNFSVRGCQVPIVVHRCTPWSDVVSYTWQHE